MSQLTPAQTAQQHNRAFNGTYQTKLGSDPLNDPLSSSSTVTSAQRAESLRQDLALQYPDALFMQWNTGGKVTLINRNGETIDEIDTYSTIGVRSCLRGSMVYDRTDEDRIIHRHPLALPVPEDVKWGSGTDSLQVTALERELFDTVADRYEVVTNHINKFTAAIVIRGDNGQEVEFFVTDKGEPQAQSHSGIGWIDRSSDAEFAGLLQGVGVAQREFLRDQISDRRENESGTALVGKNYEPNKTMPEVKKSVAVHLTDAQRLGLIPSDVRLTIRISSPDSRITVQMIDLPVDALIGDPAVDGAFVVSNRKYHKTKKVIEVILASHNYYELSTPGGFASYPLLRASAAFGAIDLKKTPVIASKSNLSHP